MRGAEELRVPSVDVPLVRGVLGALAIGLSSEGFGRMKYLFSRIKHHFRRCPKSCDYDGNAVAFVPWPLQLRMWLTLPCDCGRRDWLFSCRFGYCKEKA